MIGWRGKLRDDSRNGVAFKGRRCECKNAVVNSAPIDKANSRQRNVAAMLPSDVAVLL